jgi:hypothetical protein
VEFDAVRAALRREREKRVGSRARLEELSGVADSTIFKIETKWIDPRTGNPYVGSADQLLRLIEALPDITVSQFFARIEALTDPSLKDSDRPAAPPLTKAVDYGRSVSDRPSSADALVQRAYIEELVQQFVGAFDRLVTARTKDRRAPRAQPAHRRGAHTAR